MRIGSARRGTTVDLLLLVMALIAALVPQLAAAGSTRFERAARQVDYLDDRAQLQPAWDALVAKLPPGTRLFSIAIEDKSITVEGAAGARGLDRWTVRRARFLGLFDRDVVSGPQPVPSPSPGFRAALFDFRDIGLDRLEGLIDQAIRRAALEDPARVTRIDIGSPQVILPSPHYGRLRIALRVASGRESATVFATPDGTIVAADLSQTERAARLDLLAADDWPMQEAQAALTALAGADATIRTVEVGRKRVTLRRDNPTNPAAADFIGWDLSGAVLNGIPTLNPARDGVSYLPFRLGEVDFTKLPEVKKNALAAFGVGGAAITDVTAKKTLSPLGAAASEVVWHVTARFPGTPASRFGPFPEMDELGLAQVRADGTVIRARLPKRLRPPIDWLSGTALVRTLAELRETFGPNARIQEVRVSKGGATIYIEDPAAPGTSIELTFDEDGLAKSSFQGRSWTRLQHAFTLSQLDAFGLESVPAIVDEAYRRTGNPKPPTYRTTLYGSTGRRSPAGSPQLEVRAGGKNEAEMTYRFATGEYAPVLEQW